MAIEPGYGSQSFVETTYDRLRSLRTQAPDTVLAVDGAVRYHNAHSLLDAGADILMVGKGGYSAESTIKNGLTRWHDVLVDYENQKGSHAR